MSISPVLRSLLGPLSAVYGSAAQFRAWTYAKEWRRSKRLSKPVISVGNLTVGGTGKTPIVLWLAERFVKQGKRVAVLSRGYRGSGGTSDEIELLKARLGNRVLFGVGANRYEQGLRLEREGVDLFLLDDGFQHLQLARDVNLLLVDAASPLPNERVLPAGLLREPVSAMERADLIVVTRVGTAKEAIAATNDFAGRPVYMASTKLLGFRRRGREEKLISREEIGAGPFFAFCGIGNPEAFYKDLEKWGLWVAGKRAFRDHHLYQQGDGAELIGDAKANAALALVTTEKDLQNLKSLEFESMPVYAAVIDFEITQEAEFLRAIDDLLAVRSTRA